MNVKNRFAAACKVYDKNNSKTVMSINSILSLNKSEKDNVYSNLPESVITALESAVNHINEVEDVLFKGKIKISYSEYMEEKKKIQEELNEILTNL